MVAITLTLLIGSPAISMVMAKKHHHLTDHRRKTGTASDSLGRPCNEGPTHDECHDQSLEEQGVGSLKPGQHYGECKEGGNNDLACDVLNADGSPNRPAN